MFPCHTELIFLLREIFKSKITVADHSQQFKIENILFYFLDASGTTRIKGVCRGAYKGTQSCAFQQDMVPILCKNKRSLQI